MMRHGGHLQGTTTGRRYSLPVVRSMAVPLEDHGGGMRPNGKVPKECARGRGGGAGKGGGAHSAVVAAGTGGANE